MTATPIDRARYLAGCAPNIDRPLLNALLDNVVPGTVVAGFNDYAKHLVNVRGDNIAAIVDPDELMHGIRFREHTVGAVTAETIARGPVLYTDGALIPDVQDMVLDIAGEPLPKQLIVQLLHKLDLEAVQGRRDAGARLGEPFSMMPRDTILFLMELLRYALRQEGDVVEIGVWQGGSVWNTMKAMRDAGDQRHVHAFDAFDEWPRHYAEAIMCADEISRRLARISDRYTLYTGMVEKTLPTASIDRVCFAHIDMGYRTEMLEWLFERMPKGGVIVLDNYQHLRGWTRRFDRWFAGKGLSLIRVPFSYQAFVIL